MMLIIDEEAEESILQQFYEVLSSLLREIVVKIPLAEVHLPLAQTIWRRKSATDVVGAAQEGVYCLARICTG